MLAQKPDAKIGILYQNDDFGKDYLTGFRDVLKGRWDKVTLVSYEVTDATVDSQLVSLQAAGIDVLATIATPKFAAPDDPQGVRHELEAVAHADRRVGLGRRGDEPAGPEKASASSARPTRRTRPTRLGQRLRG